jgi:flavin-dependent dehydrogenase
MYQARRSVFDRVLLDDAVAQGARLEEGARVISAAGSDRGWRLSLEDGREVEARGLIGAGGAKCPMGRRLRAASRGTPTFPKERLAVAWAREFPVGEGFVEEAYGPERTVRIDLREGGVTGYAWVFPKRAHVNVGFWALVGELAGGKGIDLAWQYVDRLVGMGLLPKHPIGGTWQAAPIPMGGPSGPLSRPGVLSVGDCASLISPLSGDGIYYAMESGRLAAEVMDAAVGRDDLSAESLSRYGSMVKRSIVRELNILSKVAVPMRTKPIETLQLAARKPSIPPLVVQLFQGEGNLRTTAIKLYGKAILGGFRK